MVDFCDVCSAPQYVTGDGSHYCGIMLNGHEAVIDGCSCGEKFAREKLYAHIWEVSGISKDE